MITTGLVEKPYAVDRGGKGKEEGAMGLSEGPSFRL